MTQFTIKEIGVIYNDNINPYIVLHETFKKGLQGLEGFSHLQVLYWLDCLDTPELREVTTMEQPYYNGPEIMGVFATRSPVRPNSIALSATAIKTIDYDKGIIYLYYIDANDSSPLVDIKPYTPSSDVVALSQVPSWCNHWPKSTEEAATFDWSKEIK
jgi:tRNA-Thr(GGU) m(6)t(6)A37 methyltransferase TsaA